MANPAFELAKILEGWKLEEKASPTSARLSYARSINAQQPEVVGSGMAHLVDLRSRISDLRARGTDVEPFEWALPRWQAAFISAAGDIRTSALSPDERRDYPISIERLNGLKGFGIVLDAHAAGLQPRPEFVARIDAAINEAQAFVRDADISEEHRHYLLALLARIRSAMYEGRPAQMREAVNEFVGATVVAESTAEEGQKKGWANVRNNLLHPAIAGAAGNLLTQGIGVVAGFIGG
ncbi:hypothetical protein [Promicromonospora sp. NPDC060271]|uniref:hypothetical protein n=1 Tax=Promicromonospora sp. NPDC060271 TaxID=3347089 RepID=UPI00365D3F18